jgi:aerobic-type carbon monoxide dehydrogenase small subunit (CoxS/CutS family)
MIAVDTVTVRFRLNGVDTEVTTEPRRLLSDVIRDHCGLSGTKVGCEQGVCGACTVRLDGQAVRSCLVLAPQVDGADVVTVEGLGAEPAAQALIERFHQHHAAQCGFCTAGMLMTLSSHARDSVVAPDFDARAAIDGHLCRCTGYQHIIDAVNSWRLGLFV